jgi:hypothetical protein
LNLIGGKTRTRTRVVLSNPFVYLSLDLAQHAAGELLGEVNWIAGQKRDCVLKSSRKKILALHSIFPVLDSFLRSRPEFPSSSCLVSSRWTRKK